MNLHSPALLLVALLPACASSTAQEAASTSTWSQFRGPGGTAVAEGQRVAADLSLERDVRWKATVPAGSSSPCVMADRIIITGADGAQLSVLALDRESGSILWRRDFEGEDERQFDHIDSSAAMPSPCTDGEHVYAYFGSYGVIALDLEGEVVWERRLPQPESPFGVGASPILAAGNLIVPRDGAEEAALLALDTATGEDVFRIERFGFIDSFATPFLWENEERDELILTGTNQLCSFDPSGGEPLWNVQGVTIFACTTPTADESHLYYAGWSSPNASPRGLLDSAFAPPFGIKAGDHENLRPLFDRMDADGDGSVAYDETPAGRGKDAFKALDLDGDGKWSFEEFNFLNGQGGAPGKNVALSVRAGGSGDITESHVEWSWKRGLPYVASPLLHRDRLWLIKAGGILTTLDAATGERQIDRERLPVAGEYYMSPVAVGDHVLIGAASGELFVLDAADELSIANTLEFGEPLLATPAALDGRLYVRTESAVWAF